MAVEVQRVFLLAMILSGIFLFGFPVEVMVAKACPQYCLEVEYLTCSNKTSTPGCINCCFAGKGCTLHFADGSTQYCG